MSDELIEILTIEDLQGHPAPFIEAVRKSIDLKGMFLSQADFDGRSVGLTLDEYDEMMANLPAEVQCPKCHGAGWVETPKPRSRGVVHSSSAENCVTAIYHDIMGALRPKEKLPYYLRLTFEYGHALHAIVQKTFHNLSHWDTERELGKRFITPGSPEAIEYERHGEYVQGLDVKFADEVQVDLPEAMIQNGHADGVLEFDTYVRGGYDVWVRVRVVLEIKSIGDEGFKKLTKVKDEHTTQAHALYATALDVPFISFLYISKAFEAPMHEFVVAYDHKKFEDWSARKLSVLEKAIEAGEPPIPDISSHWACNDCKYGYSGGCSVRRKDPMQQNAGRKLIRRK